MHRKTVFFRKKTKLYFFLANKVYSFCFDECHTHLLIFSWFVCERSKRTPKPQTLFALPRDKISCIYSQDTWLLCLQPKPGGSPCEAFTGSPPPLGQTFQEDANFLCRQLKDILPHVKRNNRDNVQDRVLEVTTLSLRLKLMASMYQSVQATGQFSMACGSSAKARIPSCIAQEKEVKALSPIAQASLWLASPLRATLHQHWELGCFPPLLLSKGF